MQFHHAVDIRFEVQPGDGRDRVAGPEPPDRDGVGLIAVTKISLPSGLSAKHRSTKSIAIFAL